MGTLISLMPEIKSCGFDQYTSKVCRMQSFIRPDLHRMRMVLVFQLKLGPKNWAFSHAEHRSTSSCLAFLAEIMDITGSFGANRGVRER